MLKEIKKTFLFIILLFTMISCDEDKEIIFIGDSLVYQWDLQYFFPGRNSKNYGVNGAGIEDIFYWKINSSQKICVLLIGTNNIPLSEGKKYFSEDFKSTFIKSYTDVIVSLKADKVISISILPRYSKNYQKEINNAINDLNTNIKDSLSLYTNVYFLDAFDSFLKNDNINESYYTDGLHLSHYGYERLTSLLTKYL